MMLSYLLNLHPATVHFPIGFLVLASAAGLLYLFWKPSPSLLVLTWWPMFIGWVSCAIAVLTGLLAQSDLPPDAPYWRLLNGHVTTGLAILLIYGAPLYTRWTHRTTQKSTRQSITGDSEDSSDPLLDRPSHNANHWPANHWPAKYWVSFCLIVGAVLVILTGWSGGQLVYNWGVNVGGQ